MRLRTDCGGFVLMEAVVALTIISLLALGLLGASTMQVRTADKANLLLHARALAEERVATLRALNHQDLSRPPDSLVAGRFPPPFEAYTWRAELAPIDGEYDLFSIGVVVMVADEAFHLHTLVHEPQPMLGAQQPAEQGRQRVEFPLLPMTVRR
jgi:type II secretory pathway pseudopilin PulG